MNVETTSVTLTDYEMTSEIQNCPAERDLLPGEHLVDSDYMSSPVNDKGVDVVADIDLGISPVREVVQVRRRRGNADRRVLDQRRSSPHRFIAVRHRRGLEEC